MMLLSKDMSQIEIMRSVGLTSKNIKHQYMSGTLTVLVFGIFLGVLASNYLGEVIVSMAMSNMGAAKIQFVNIAWQIYSLIDAKTIGVAGHSHICAILQALMEMSLHGNTEPYPCAVMNIYSDSGYPLIETDNKYVQNKNYLYNNGNVEYYYIEGSNHYTLTDLVRRSPIVCALLGGGYQKSGYDTLNLINQKSLAFFDKYLNAL